MGRIEVGRDVLLVDERRGRYRFEQIVLDRLETRLEMYVIPFQHELADDSL